MVVIRLARGGSKKRPFYTVVVSDKRSARDGRCIERLGSFNPTPRGKESALTVNLDRIEYWLSEGAQPSDTVRSLIKNAKKAKATETVAAA